jgi:hypothetical protein
MYSDNVSTTDEIINTADVSPFMHVTPRIMRYHSKQKRKSEANYKTELCR